MTNIHVPYTGRQPGQVPEARDEAARVHGPRVHRPAHQAVSAVTGLELSTRQFAKSRDSSQHVILILSAEANAMRVRG